MVSRALPVRCRMTLITPWLFFSLDSFPARLPMLELVEALPGTSVNRWMLL